MNAVANVSRRVFLKAAGAAPLVGAVHAAEANAASRPEPLFLLNTYVAGAAYYKAAEVWESLAVGQVLSLRRQPDNAHDDLAIEVFTASGVKLGYVPRADNEPFARLLDAGRAVSAQVCGLQRYHSRHDIGIDLFLV